MTAYDVYMANVKRAHTLAASERTNLAAPEAGKLPMPDEEHARLAWDMVDKTKGLSGGEREAAKARIKARLHHFDVSTGDYDASPGVNKSAFDTDTANPINQVAGVGAGLGAVAGGALAHKAIAPHLAMAKDEAGFLKGHPGGGGAALREAGWTKLHRGGTLAGMAAGAAIGAAPGMLMALGNKFGEREH